MSHGHIAVQLRPVGNCDNADTSETIPYIENGKKASVCLKQPVLADENDISDINVSKDQNGVLLLTVRFREKGAARLKKGTAEIVGQKLAFLLNGEIFSVATVQEIVSSDIALFGRFNEDELQQLVNSLKDQVRRKGAAPNTNRVGT